METADQLKFIVDFANRDLTNTREGDWLNLQEDLERFFLGFSPADPIPVALPGMVTFSPAGDEEYKKYPKQKIVSLQNQLKTLLWTRLAPKDTSRMMLMKLEITYAYASSGCLIATGKFRDLVLQRVINLLGDSKTVSSIRQCPQCGNIFIRVRRQKYCSGPCVDKANKAAWLKTTNGKRYLRKMKKRRSRRKHQLAEEKEEGQK